MKEKRGNRGDEGSQRKLKICNHYFQKVRQYVGINNRSLLYTPNFQN